MPDLGTKIWWDASLWEGNLLQYEWYTSAILKHVKLLGLAEQNHGYLTSFHRIRSDKIADKERRVRKFPTIEMATMLWRHMVIKFDNDPGLVMALLEAWKVTNNGRPLRFYQVKTARNGDFLRLTWKLTDNGSQYGLLQISTLRDFSHKIYSYCWKKLKKHVLSLKNGLTTCCLWRHIS